MKNIKRFNAHYDEALIYDYSKHFNLHPKIIEILLSRELYEKDQIEKFLHPKFSDLYDPYLLSGMKEGIERIKRSIKNKERILIFGDYDVDGISATAILIKCFKKLGIDANYFLPNRFVDGYGLTTESIDKVISLYHPNLIITVDCGITCSKEVEYVKSLGIDIIISDHHELDETLPNTICINPKIPNQNYPFQNLCGAGVAYKIAQALLGEKCDEELLAICGLATITDIVPLVDENRTLVYYALQNISYLPKGIKAMIKENKIDLSKINSTDLSFKVSPKLNASGRMGEANDSLKLFLENDNNKIKYLIEKINGHNKKRQELCNVMYDDCLEMLKNEQLCNSKCIILSSENWDSGILGIIAARLVEKFHRPAFLFAEADGILKGSGRSIDDINIHDILMSSGDLLTTFGGHSMAAGLTLNKENLDSFKERVNLFIEKNVNDQIFNTKNYYDIDIEQEDINQEFIDQINLLEPFGCSNPKPYFKISSKGVNIQPLKNFKNHANFCFKNDLKLICFNYLEKIDYLTFSQNYDIVFEFQQSYNKKEFKGLIKYFDFPLIPNQNISQYCQASIINQLVGDKIEKLKLQNCVNFYKNKDLISLLLDNSKSSFGTLYVCYNYQTYINFIQNYDISKIEQNYFFELENNGGFNSIVLAPTSFKYFENFINIIFLDDLVDNSFLYNLNLTNCQIYIPANNLFNINFLSKISTSRDKFAQIYNALKILKDKTFASFQKLHYEVQKVLKYNISFEMLYFVLQVFNELNIIYFDYNEYGFSIFNNDIKTNLSNSQLYNKVVLLSKTMGGNNDSKN